MRFPVCLALLASCLIMCSCLNEGSALLDPTGSESESMDDAYLAPSASEMRIVQPHSGATFAAGITFDVLVSQEVRGGPYEGRAQLQYSKNERDWFGVGDAFPWSSQSREFSIYDVDLSTPGALTLRLIVYEVDPSRPLLESTYTAVRCLDHDVAEDVKIS